MICSFVKTTEDEKNERSRYSHARLGFRVLTKESGDVRRVEGEVCGAVLVDE